MLLKLNLMFMLGAGGENVAWQLPFAHSGKSKLFQNFAALHRTRIWLASLADASAIQHPIPKYD